MKLFIGSLFLLCTASSCSPLKSSPNEEKHQLELTLHELRTNYDDQRHDLNCFQTELQILDGRIKYYENALANLKQHEIDKNQAKLDQLQHQLLALEKKVAAFEQADESTRKDVRRLTSHANETSSALVQFKERIQELEQGIQVQNHRFDEIAKLKTHVEGFAKQQSKEKLYKVRSGDTLEKIAKMHKCTVDALKKSNELDHDLIGIGQELRIPE